jgi:putative transposase
VRGGQVGGTIIRFRPRNSVHGTGDGAGLRRSMGATGICWDNRGAESLWSTFEHDYYYYYRHAFAARAEFAAAVDK